MAGGKAGEKKAEEEEEDQEEDEEEAEEWISRRRKSLSRTDASANRTANGISLSKGNPFVAEGISLHEENLSPQMKSPSTK